MAATHPAECSIKVVCRFRPLNDAEVKNGSSFTAKFLSENTCKVEDKTYSFDRVYHPHVDQKVIYEGTAKALINNVLSGYNGTIFAYGQTSSGKTYTMEGVVGDSVFQGIIPRAVQDLFDQIAIADSSIRFCIKVSYFELYMEKIRDLLNVANRDLDIREDRNRVPYVKGCTEREVSSAEEMMAAIEEGKANREISSTNMNEQSSRSHSVCLINITQEQSAMQKKLTGKLCLVDLAGSEKVSKTGADGKQLEEAKRINSSLSVLRKVIFALSNGEGFVPYRESKLTRVLQESLGGNAKTTVIVCCSPASYNVEETKSTLLFGVSAKTIKNVVKINEELTVDEWKRLVEKERATSRHRDWVIGVAMQELDRWRNGDYVPRTEWLDIPVLLQEKNHIVENGNAAAAWASRGNVGSGNLASLPAPPESEEITSELTNQITKENQKSAACFVAEKAFLLTKLAEAECENDILKNRVDDAKEQLNAVLEAVEANNSNNPDEAPFLADNPLVDRLRSIRQRLTAAKRDEDEKGTADEEGVVHDEEHDIEDAEQIACRQENVSRQMERLLEQIKEKEQQIVHTLANAENIEKMRSIYEVEINELKQRIDSLQHERDEIQHQAKSQSNVSKVNETRRLKLQDLEKQLAECRRKIQDLQRLEKIKAQNDEKIKTLRAEVETMKNSRVKLMRQMREDNERYRKTQVKIELEMNQVRQKGKRQQYEAEKAKQTMDRQLTVYRRKYEEAVSVNKRLQGFLEKQKSARNDRLASLKENGKMAHVLKEYLKDELALQVSTEEARNLLTQLEQQREELQDQLRQLERGQMRRFPHSNEGEPPKKTNYDNGGTQNDAKFGNAQMEQRRLEMSALREELQNRDTQISQLKAKIGAFDVEMRDNQRWAQIHTVVHAQAALKFLFEMTVNANMDKLAVSNRLAETEAKNDEIAAQVGRLEQHLKEMDARFNEMEKQHAEEWDHREHEHQIQISNLLRHAMKSYTDRQLDENQMEHFIKFCENTEVVENLSAQLDRKDREAKKLTQELSKAKVRATGSRKFFDFVASNDTILEELDSENQNDDSKHSQNRSSRMRREPERYGKIANSTSAILDPDSPMVGVSSKAGPSTRRRRTTFGNADKRKTAISANSTFSLDDGMKSATGSSSADDSAASHNRRASGDESASSGASFIPDEEEMQVGRSEDDAERTFVAAAAAATISRKRRSADAAEDEELNEDVVGGGLEQSAINKSPLANMGISKPFTPRGSLFEPGVAKKKFFQ